MILNKVIFLLLLMRLDQVVYGNVLKATENPLQNCEQLHNYFSVAWQIDGNRIIYEFTGALDSENGYMAFGISGSKNQSVMLGADVLVVTWNTFGRIFDYFIDDKSECLRGEGVCYDYGGTYNALQYNFSQQEDGITTVRFSRPLNTGDLKDKAVSVTDEMYVIWAMGKMVRNIPQKHTLRLQGDLKINFGRPSFWNCVKVIPRTIETAETATKVQSSVKSSRMTPVNQILTTNQNTIDNSNETSSREDIMDTTQPVDNIKTSFTVTISASLTLEVLLSCTVIILKILV